MHFIGSYSVALLCIGEFLHYRKMFDVRESK